MLYYATEHTKHTKHTKHMERIAWNESENRAVGESLLILRLAHPLKSIHECLRDAQGVLPPHRRRNMPAATQWKGLNDWVGFYHSKVKRVAEPPPEPVVEVQEVVVREVVQPCLEDVLRNATLEQLIGAQAQRLMALASGNAMESLARMMRAAAPKTEEFMPPPKGVMVPVLPKLLRIAVSGPMKDQFEHIKQKVGDRAELVFIDSLRKGTRTPAVDHIIISRHNQHCNFDKARAAGIATHFVSSGITGPVQKIFDLISKHAPVVKPVTNGNGVHA